MNTALIIDCAFPDAVIALRHNESIQSACFGPQRSHALRIVDELDGLLRKAGLKADQIDRIGVGQGPGSFTGLRVALATATGLAQAGGAELVGFSTFDALPVFERPTLYAFDARQGMVYCGVRVDERWVHQPAALSVADAALLKTEVDGFLGNAGARYPELVDGLRNCDLGHHPVAERALALTAQAVSGRAVLPTYKEGAQAQRLFGTPDLGRALDADELTSS